MQPLFRYHNLGLGLVFAISMILIPAWGFHVSWLDHLIKGIIFFPLMLGCLGAIVFELSKPWRAKKSQTKFRGFVSKGSYDPYAYMKHRR